MQGLEQKHEEYQNVIRTLETKNQKLSELNDTIKKDTLFYQNKCQEEEKEKMELENKLMEIESVVRYNTLCPFLEAINNLFPH